MLWADAIPNLLIGLREGLEAGLVVSILLAALRKTSEGERRSSFPIWIGVVGAVSVAGSFAAVLTYSTNVLSSQAQEAIGGILSVLAVFLVSWMIFWMRRTARDLSGDLTERVRSASLLGSGALAVTAFLAVGREGLETTLFLWTAAKASGSTVAPLVGAGIGIGIAVLLCWLLFRGAVRMNLGVFFSRTAILLIVVAAGILAYGLGDLQDAGLLSGQNWIAFDISGSVAADSWWMTIITGATELQTRMTVLQVVAWVVYLAIMLTLFLRRPREEDAPVLAEVETESEPSRQPVLERWLHAAERRMWIVVVGLVVAPALIAVGVIAVLPTQQSSAQTAITVTTTSCGTGWTSGHTGAQTFLVTNNSGKAAEINLDDSAGAVVAEIETLGPATTAPMSATLEAGSYSFTCFLSGRQATVSPVIEVSGSHVAAATAAVVPVTVKDLAPANAQYETYAAGQLADLSAQIGAIQADLAGDDVAKAKTDWMAAQEDWERVGASYDSFGEFGEAVDGLPEAYQGGVNSAQFTGLHRLEYGLWHNQPVPELQAVTTTLADNVLAVQQHLSSPDLAGDPINLPIRAHEILEDALRDHLSGQDDEGSGAAYAETYADTQVTGIILGYLGPQLTERAPGLLQKAQKQLATLQSALEQADVGGSWNAPDQVSLSVRQHIDSAIGAALETLSSVPDVLEVPPHP